MFFPFFVVFFNYTRGIRKKGSANQKTTNSGGLLLCAPKMWEFVDAVVGISLRNKGAARRHMAEASLQDSGLGLGRLRWLLREPDAESGHAGCFRSHVAACKSMLESAARWGVVFEDDVRFFGAGGRVEDVQRAVGDFCATVPEDEPCWIQLGYYIYKTTMHGGVRTVARSNQGRVLRVGGSACMHAYLINRAMMRQVASLQWSGTTIDVLLVFRAPHYVVAPMLFHQANDTGSQIAEDDSYSILAVQRLLGMRQMALFSDFVVAQNNAFIAITAVAFAILGAAFAVCVWAAATTKVRPDARGNGIGIGIVAGVFAAFTGAALLLLAGTIAYATTPMGDKEPKAPFPLIRDGRQESTDPEPVR